MSISGPDNFTKRKRTIKIPALFIAGVLIAASLVALAVRYLINPQEASLFPRRIPVECRPDNPFEYSIDSLGIVDSALIGYREERHIPLSLTEPQAIGVGTDGRYYAAGDSVIQVIDSSGAVVWKIKVGESVHCLAVDEQKKLYAGSLRKVRVFSAAHTLFNTWDIGGDNTCLTSIAVDENKIFVADAGIKVVWCLDTMGVVTGKIGLRDTGRGIPGFIVPSAYMDVAVGREGSLWVVDPGRHLLENYRPNGDLIYSWGSSGAGVINFCGCCGPIQMTLLSDGSFVTAEKGIVRVKVYDAAGRFMTMVAPHAAFDPRETNLDLAVDLPDNILVLDTYEKQIRIFKKKNI